MSLVSIIIPVYNRGKFLPETIESVINQSYKNWELLLIDDGSTDLSIQIAQEFANRDSRIKSIQRDREPKGAPTCRNIGMTEASGKYLIFLDSDDSLEPFCLYQRVAYMTNNLELDYSVWNICVQKSNDKLEIWCDLNFNRDDLKSRLLLKSWQTSAPIYKTSSITKFQWDEQACSWQDWEFAIKLLLDESLSYAKLLKSIPDVKINRQHRENISSTSRSFERILCLFKLVGRNEQLLVQKGKLDYIQYLKEPLFGFAEIASIEFNDKGEFRAVYSFFTSLLTFSHYKNKVLIKTYLKVQNTFRSLGFMQSIMYRCMKYCLKSYAI